MNEITIAFLAISTIAGDGGHIMRYYAVPTSLAVAMAAACGHPIAEQVVSPEQAGTSQPPGVFLFNDERFNFLNNSD